MGYKIERSLYTMRTYTNLRASVLNKMASLFPNDGTQYQYNLWEDGESADEAGYYIISYRIYGFGQVGCRIWVEDGNVTCIVGFCSLPGSDEDIREFLSWVEGPLGDDTDPLQTLNEFVEAGGNAAKVLERHCSVVKSSYFEHYQDGDSDETVAGFNCKAAVGAITCLDGINYVCVRSYETSSEDRGWSGCRNSTYWVRLFNLHLYADKLLLDEATLMQSAVSIEGTSIESLLKLPINWTELIGHQSGITNSYSYMYGRRVEIIVCDLYVTVHVIETRNSSTRQRGWEYIAGRVQYLKDGTDNTPAYVAYCNRKHYAEKLSALLADGISLADAKRWLKASSQWKHENSAAFCIEMAKLANKKFWLELSGARGWNHASKIIQNAGLQLDWSLSFPRMTDQAALISQLCTDDAVVGVGWTLTREA